MYTWQVTGLLMEHIISTIYERKQSNNFIEFGEQVIIVYLSIFHLKRLIINISYEFIVKLFNTSLSEKADC